MNRTLRDIALTDFFRSSSLRRSFSGWSFLWILWTCPDVSGHIIYVDRDSTGRNDGSSWGDAYTDLQDALGKAKSAASPAEPVEIWVAQGVYKPASRNGDRLATFSLCNHCRLYGGFAGGEAMRDDRRPLERPTVLSGDLNGDDQPGFYRRDENSYHVVTADGVNEGTVLDGFVIERGNADLRTPLPGHDTVVPHNGAGGLLVLRSRFQVSNCIFRENRANYGGGLVVEWDSALTISACRWIENEALFEGGAVRFQNGSIPDMQTAVVNCVFAGNRAARGGAMDIAGSGSTVPVLSHCTVYCNSATDDLLGIRGGGIYCYDEAGCILVNSIVWGNRGNGSGNIDEGSQIYGGSPQIDRCCIQGWTGILGGEGNFGDDPMFVDPLGPDGILGTFDDDLRLHFVSPCIDAGIAQPGVEFDISGNARSCGTAPDLGPYESCEFVQIARRLIFVERGAQGIGDGSSWGDAFTDLQDALLAADGTASPATKVEVWVAAGIYSPAGLGGDREKSFRLIDGCELYGGFAGGELRRDARRPDRNLTILSGDLNRDDGPEFTRREDNAFHVIEALHVGSTARVDGFEIAGGEARRMGIAGNPFDFGGGVFLSESAPRFQNCLFRENRGTFGGAVYIDGDSDPVFQACRFLRNSADEGGAVDSTFGSLPVFENCVFSGNAAERYGGGLALVGIAGEAPRIVNCTFYDNRAGLLGGGIYAASGGMYILNSIFWANAGFGGKVDQRTQIDVPAPAINASCVQGLNGELGGLGNIGFDPMFLSPRGPDGIAGTRDDDLSLVEGSPCIDAGAGIDQGAPTSDLFGNPRPYGAGVDLGAVERFLQVLHVKKDASGRGDGLSWQDAFPKLQDALAEIGRRELPPRSVEIWIAEGVYTPAEPGGDRGASFELQGAALYGGFAGIETTRMERKPSLHPTVLSGDLNGDDAPGFENRDDNSYHVLVARDGVLDGLVVAGGNAFGDPQEVAPGDLEGGGLLIPEIEGGSTARVAVNACSFQGNRSYRRGGAIYSRTWGSLDASSTVFAGNRSAGGSAVAVWGVALSTRTDLRNCTIFGNRQDDFGAAAVLVYGEGDVVNCIFWANENPAGRESGAQISYSPERVMVRNNLIEGWNDAMGGPDNIDLDPLLVNPAGADGVLGTSDDDLRLQAGSPGIDRGLILSPPLSRDPDGNRRPCGNSLDLGAYEDCGDCTYSVAPPSIRLKAEGAEVLLNVTAPPGCIWRSFVLERESWIGIGSGDSGSGNGEVKLKIEANRNVDARRARILVAGTEVSITQNGAAPLFRAVKVSVKVFLEDGKRREGFFSGDGQIRRAIQEANQVLVANRVPWELVIAGIEEVAGSVKPPEVYDSVDLKALEDMARADPGSFRWRDDAINVYILETMRGGGLARFPGEGDIVAICNSTGIPNGGIGWLHEIGHYLGLVHTFECEDPPCDFGACTGAGYRRGGQLVACEDICKDPALAAANVMGYGPRTIAGAVFSECQKAAMLEELGGTAGSRKHVVWPISEYEEGGIPKGDIVIFKRGDSNDDGRMDISDAIFTLFFLFLGGRSMSCIDAADADGNGAIEITDPIVTLSYLFLGNESAIPFPGPHFCSVDVSEEPSERCNYRSGCYPPSGDPY